MVTKKEFPNQHVFQTEIGGRPFTVITLSLIHISEPTRH